MWGRIKIRKSDTLFRQYLLKLRGCKSAMTGVFYPEGKGLFVSHFHGRRKESVRFDEENCDLFSFSEHQYFEENPSQFTEWKKKQLGEKRFKLLTLAANTYKKKDEKLQIIILQELLKTIASGEGVNRKSAAPPNKGRLENITKYQDEERNYK